MSEGQKMSTSVSVMASSAVDIHAEARAFLPVFDITLAVKRKEAMRDFIQQILVPDVDYGVIPGTNKEKVLKKPGAEKLCTFFGLSPRFEAECVLEDWSGAEHGGEPLFYYRYKCLLWRGDRLLAEAVGSCNSREKKYRYRSSDRLCPACNNPTIIKGKAEYGGGWLCFAKKGGCGAKFSDGDAAIEGQHIGQVPNPDIADVVNTCQKIAQKRALVAAVLIGTNASDSFTQDLEEDLEKIQERSAAAKTTETDPELEAILASCKNPATFKSATSALDGRILAASGPEAADQVWRECVEQFGDDADSKRAMWPKWIAFHLQMVRTAEKTKEETLA